MSRGRSGGVGVLALAVVVALGSPAAAHPFVRDDGQVPARSLATMLLDLGHGCFANGHGHDHGDEELATTHVAMEVPEPVTHVDPHPVEGWEVETEREDGRIAVVVWSEDGGAEPAPTFPLDVVIEGEPGDEVHLRLVQSCGDETIRWVGTPDQPADNPAVGLVLTEPDPDRAPPDPRPDVEPEAPGPEEATEPEQPTESDGTTTRDEPIEAEAAAEPAGDGRTLALMGLVGAAVAAVVGIVLWWQRRRSGAAA